MPEERLSDKPCSSTMEAVVTSMPAAHHLSPARAATSTGCFGLHFLAFNKFDYRPGFCFATHYLFYIYSFATQTQFAWSKAFIAPTWRATSDGYLYGESYKRTVQSGKEGDACEECNRLKYNQQVNQVLGDDAMDSYSKFTPYQLLPHKALISKKNAL